MSTASPSAKLVKAKGTPKVTKNEAPVEQTATEEKVKPKAAVEKVAADVAPDLIVQIAHEVEGLHEKKAFAMVQSLVDNIDNDYFKLGGVLSRIQSGGWFMNQGYENFKSYVVAEVGIEYRRALYFIGIYNGLVQSGVKWALVKHLGWTKLKELASFLTPENAEEWIGMAEQMTVLQLQEYIKKQQAALSPVASGPVSEEAKKTTTMTFTLHADQKMTVREALDKCKAQMSTEYDAVALEHIALDYLSGDKKLKKVPTLAEQMKGKSAEEVLEIFTKVFPEVELSATVPE